MGHASQTPPGKQPKPAAAGSPQTAPRERPVQPSVPEIGGPKGPEPTRFGDWEKGGRCTDF
jgi:hypothetical protein